MLSFSLFLCHWLPIQRQNMKIIVKKKSRVLRVVFFVFRFYVPVDQNFGILLIMFSWFLRGGNIIMRAIRRFLRCEKLNWQHKNRFPAYVSDISPKLCVLFVCKFVIEDVSPASILDLGHFGLQCIIKHRFWNIIMWLHNNV